MSTALDSRRSARRARSPKGSRRSAASRIPLLPMALAFVAVAAALAVVLSNTGGADPREAAAVEARQYGAVAVSGEALPPLAGAVAGADAAVGRAAPSLSGADFDSNAVSIPGDSDAPTLVVFGAHWCPYCQREIPRVVDWMAAGNATGINVVAVSTGADPKAPNWTPEAWLEREQCAAPVLVDDSEASAAKAFGVDGYPFFTLLDAEGTVVWRGSGEIGMDVLDRVVGGVR